MSPKTLKRVTIIVARDNWADSWYASVERPDDDIIEADLRQWRARVTQRAADDGFAVTWVECNKFGIDDDGDQSDDWRFDFPDLDDDDLETLDDLTNQMSLVMGG